MPMNQTLTILKLKVKDITLLADQNLFVVLMVTSTVRMLDIDEMLTHSQGPLSLSLANCNGLLVKTIRAKLLHVLEMPWHLFNSSSHHQHFAS